MPELLSPQQLSLRETARSFAESLEADATTQAVRNAAKQVGFFGMTQPKDFGGSAASTIELVVVRDELAAHRVPHPEAVFGLDTSKYTNAVHNITAIAYDEAGNKEQTSVFVKFENSGILNFNYIPYLIGAGVRIAISVLGSLIFRRKKK